MVNEMKTGITYLIVLGLIINSSSIIFFQTSGLTSYRRTIDNNNSFDMADEIINGSSISDSVNKSDDLSDYYKIEVQSGFLIKAKLVIIDNSSNPSIYLNIFDPLYNSVTSYTIYELLKEYPTRAAIGLAVMTGTYYIEVDLARGDELQYNLSVSLTFPEIVNGGDVLNGTLSGMSDHIGTFYRVWLENNITGKNEGIDITLHDESTTKQFTLKIRDIVANYTSQTYNRTLISSEYKEIKAAASYTGWYYISIFSPNETGNYSLNVRKYLVGSDSNNDFLQACSTFHNSVKYGSLDKSEDHYDWYSYQIYANDELQITGKSLTGSDIYNLSVFDCNKTYVCGANNYGHGTPTSEITLTIPTVNYNIKYFIFISAYQAFRFGHNTDDTAYIDYQLIFNSTNRAPQGISPFQNISMDEDTKKSISIKDHFQDLDSDQLSFFIKNTTYIYSIYNSINDSLMIIPEMNWYGNVSLSIVADDSFGGIAILPLNITVVSVNDAPFVKRVIPDVVMNQGGMYTSINLSYIFYDNDSIFGDHLTFNVSQNFPLDVKIQSSGAVSIYDPITFYGTLIMIFSATDELNTSAYSSCNVTVLHVNQPPMIKIIPENISMNENTNVTIDMSSTFMDLDNDPILLHAYGMFKISLIIDPITLHATFAAGSTANQFYEDIIFIATDNMKTESDAVTIRVTVNPVNDPPRIIEIYPIDNISVDPLDIQRFSIDIIDDKFTAIQYIWSLDNTKLENDNNTFFFKPNYSQVGAHEISLVIIDGEWSIYHNWSVLVNKINKPPINVIILSPQDSSTFIIGRNILFFGNAEDPDGDFLSYEWYYDTKLMATGISINTSINEIGVHTIYFIVCDGIIKVKSKQIVIKIIQNSAPKILEINPQRGSRFSNSELIKFNVIAKDDNNDNLSYSWIEGNSELSNSTSFSRIFDIGHHSIIISVSDGLATVNSTIEFTVTDEKAILILISIIGGSTILIIVILIISINILKRQKRNQSK